MAKKKPNNTVPILQTKSFSFQSSSRAQHAYDQAVQIINDRFFMQGSKLVTITGNVVTVPSWFPFSAN